MTKEEFNRIPIGGNMEVTLNNGETYDLTGVDWSISQVEIGDRWIDIEHIKTIEDKG